MEVSDWHRVDPVDVQAESRVRSVTVDGRTVALARCGARLGALENRCPHQGGPLGEGSIENGWLRCPWHGYDYDPLTGQPPGGLSDGVATYQVDERPDGVYVRNPALAPRSRTVSAAGPRPASRSRGRARPTCSPACTTPSPTSHRCWRSPVRYRPRSWAGGPSRTST